MRVDEFDFDLPPERIALRPAEPRESARLLVVRGGDRAEIWDSTIVDLPGWLQPGDCLVVNDTKVLPARLTGYRHRKGFSAKIEVTLHKRESDHEWRAFVRPAKRLTSGDTIIFGATEQPNFQLPARVVEKAEAGEVVLRFDLLGAELDEAIASVGAIPLPPYISAKRDQDAQDLTDYQTMFADRPGAVAAPTAGLHFTPELMARLVARGIEIVRVTLHVGAGTFLPVKADDTKDHVMHAEWGEISSMAAEKLNRTRSAGLRIVAVGTTSLRLLESAVDRDGRFAAWAGDTAIFITPGFQFKAVDVLMTNFHLPRSTLLMLVSAFSGIQRMKRAYRHAIEVGYRFYSYGDACLLHRASDD
jgi:S-adenosylmethionine:tRNA ribosyltransferase-isomerase